MVTKRQTKNNYTKIEKVLTFTGIGVILLGCVANTFSAINNSGFISDGVDFIYYSRYILLLLGGLLTGYISTKRGAAHTKWFGGVVYAALAMLLFDLLDVLRLASQNILGFIPFPWSKILFEGQPLVVLVILVFIAILLSSRLQRLAINKFTKVLSIVSLALYQGFVLADSLYYLNTNAGSFSSISPIWLVIVEYLATPLVIGVIGYFVLAKVKVQLDRVFFATLVAVLYSIFTTVIWEFRTDPSSAATNVFGSVVLVLGLLFALVVLWKARRAVTK